MSNPEFLTTLAVALAALAIFGVLSWRERRPRQSLNPSLIPATPLLFVSGTVAIFAVVHLVNLLGITTGR